MKVLWLVSWYPSKVDVFSGDFIQRQALAVSRLCEVYVIYVVKDEFCVLDKMEEEIVKGKLTEKIIYYQTPVTGIKIVDRIISHKKSQQLYISAINNYFKTNGRPNVVHVHVAMKAGLAAIWLKRKWGIPFMLTEHWGGYYADCVPSVNDYNPVLLSLNKKILKNADVFLTVSANLGETIKRDFVNVAYKTIPNVVDTDLFFYTGLKPLRFRFIHPSRMDSNKNPTGILRACKILKGRGYDFEMQMIGALNEDAIALAKELGLYNNYVFFSPAISYDSVALEMQQSSALLLFSFVENMPCVILEALCCGLPVISSNTGGISEVINESNGILVEKGNEEELANAMCTIIDKYPAYNRKEIAESATAKFNYDTIAQSHIDMYKMMTDTFY
jgi:glycosyltransferase involved in cell wall biosynthesis